MNTWRNRCRYCEYVSREIQPSSLPFCCPYSHLTGKITTTTKTRLVLYAYTMASTTPSPFLSLPQELRDIIYQHALRDSLRRSDDLGEHKADEIRRPAKQEHDDNNAEGSLLFNYAAQCPRPVWYTLLLCCRTTNRDIRELAQTTALNQMVDIKPAVVDLNLSPTTSTATWQRLPSHPQQITSLQINIRLSQIYESSLTSASPDTDNAIIRAIFHLVRQYCCFGPHLSRGKPLSRPLQLETVLLEIEPDLRAIQPPQGLVFANNHPQQLATVSGVFWIWLSRFARSGLLWERVENLKWNCKYIAETEGEVVTSRVTNHGWSEDDRTMFRELGYSWD